MLRGTAKDRPKGLTSIMISTWLNGTRSSAKKRHLDYVIARWEKVIESGHVMIDVSDEMLQELRHQNKRTGVSPIKLMRMTADVPPGLTSNLIFTWLSDSINTQKAHKHHLDFVLAAWSSLPDSNSEKYARSSDATKIAITPEIQQEIRRLISETNVTASRLLHEAPAVPKGLTASVINDWLRGDIEIAYKRHLEYTINRWKRWNNT
ncbi:hypothetical protein CVM39_17850 [Pseudooceanicola antarcticus]|uniref:Uncharacterized protein n=1 Tax=Pseudooceanicola antarcticus TaxID=1247613 RepID=A0ABX4MJW2_9RHOB|nr:hypothetical protein CVM39_17850 [Pseudooceanicola antarcticus]